MLGKLIQLGIVLTLAISCNNQPNMEIRHSHDEYNTGDPHWSYQGETGPEHWIEIERNTDCDGKMQSPVNIIDIETVKDKNLEPIAFYYSKNVKIHDVTNNGHSIQYNFEKGDYAVVKNEKYDLIQIHFHEPSEHTINGVRYPIETHLVHINQKDKSIVVFAILGIEGESNEVFEFLEEYLPLAIGETKEIDSYFDFNLIVPNTRDYYNYMGSLTTPPCTEGVGWYVFTSPITLSLEQVKKLQQVMPFNNYRNEQPLNNRIVKQFVSNAKAGI